MFFSVCMMCMHVYMHVDCRSSPATLIQIFLLLATAGPQASRQFSYLSSISHLRNTGVIDTDYCVQFHMGSGDSHSGLPTCSAISPGPGMLFPKGLTTFTCSRRRCPFSCALLHTAHYLWTNLQSSRHLLPGLPNMQTPGLCDVELYAHQCRFQQRAVFAIVV